MPNVKKLKEQGDVEGLIQLLRKRNPTIGKQAYYALIGLLDERAVGPLVAALDDKRARLWATMLLAELNDPHCLEPLAEVAGDTHLDRMGSGVIRGVDGRLGPARKLVDLKHPQAADALAGMIEDSIYWKEAVFELAALKDPRAIEPLIAWVSDEDFKGRPTPSIVGARDAKTAQRRVPARAADALVKFGGSVIAPLKAALQRTGSKNRQGLRALVELGDTWAVEELRKAETAVAAAVAAIQAGDARSQPGTLVGRPLTAGGVCDLCSGAVPAVGGLRLSADEMRLAVRAGLRPRGAAANIGATLGVGASGWVDMVMRDTTDWTLCADCGSAARAL